MSLVSALEAAESVLGELGVGWCVIGGLAVATRTPTRLTIDVDLAVAVADDQQAEQVTMAFLRRGFSLVAALEHEATGRLASVRLERGPAEQVDLMFALTGIEADVVASADRIEVVPGHEAPTASVAHLVAMKLLSVDERRPRDQQDLLALLGELRPDAQAGVRDALRAITSAGTARGRDLSALFEAWLERTG
jgi:hypothetical protein